MGNVKYEKISSSPDNCNLPALSTTYKLEYVSVTRILFMEIRRLDHPKAQKLKINLAK